MFTTGTEYIKYSPLSDRKTRIIRKVYILFTGLATAIEYIDYSTDSGRITRIIRRIVKRSIEMAKIATPAQEFSEKSEKSL